MEDKEDELNKLRIENEIKKMKLSLEHGANFFSPSENKLSPELEGEWLNQVQKFEDSYAKSKKFVIYDFVEKPTYKPVNEIPEAEIKSELKRILNLLSQKGVGIDTICKVDDRELYRFITEELFLEETDDMMIEGMTHNFIYEEFHPNHEHDIKTHCSEFVDGLLNKKVSLNPSFMAMSNEIHSNDGIIKQEDAVKRMEAFREAFSSFKLQHFKITSLKIAENIADVCFDINYTGIIEGGNESRSFTGIGGFMLKYEHDYWCINKISIPGVPY
jgi:hypothetical protein